LLRQLLWIVFLTSGSNSRHQLPREHLSVRSEKEYISVAKHATEGEQPRCLRSNVMARLPNRARDEPSRHGNLCLQLSATFGSDSKLRLTPLVFKSVPVPCSNSSARSLSQPARGTDLSERAGGSVPSAPQTRGTRQRPGGCRASSQRGQGWRMHLAAGASPPPALLPGVPVRQGPSGSRQEWVLAEQRSAAVPAEAVWTYSCSPPL